MVAFMKVINKIIRDKDKESIFIQMEHFMKGNGIKIKWKELENFIIMIF